MEHSEKHPNKSELNQDLFNSDGQAQSHLTDNLVQTSFVDSELLQSYSDENSDFESNITVTEAVSPPIEDDASSEEAEETDLPDLEYRESESVFEQEIPHTDNALKVLERRYLKKDDAGNAIETPKDMFRRVARTMAEADLLYDPDADVDATERAFYAMMSRLEFIPNSPTLMNAGRELGQLSACFVLPVEDSMESIFESVKHTALIHKSGGGTGFSFSQIRPKNDIVQSTKGVASGPISFMHVFDEATETVKQGGTRRGANMAILRVDHPDILDFIQAKEQDDKLNNFNISVAVTETFWKAYQDGKAYDLINPHDKTIAGQLDAREVFDKIVTRAWKNGDPGIVFIDRINSDNPTPNLGDLESTNPCGEQPLLPYESCNLGSINLSRIIRESGDNVEIDWDKLLYTTRASVHFLDNVIDQNRYPLEQIDKMTRSTRKIGLGVMGFADLLIKLGIPYNSDKAIETAQNIMQFIREAANRKSAELADKRGPFPEFKGSKYDKNGETPLRNSTRTTIAPTGTISIIAGCSSGIEPLFALAFTRHVMDDDKLPEVNPLLTAELKKRGIYTEDLIRKVADQGSLEGIEDIPLDMREIFVTSHEIAPDWHIRMQAAFQNHTDNAVSKTVNFSNGATVEDVATVYQLAQSLGCKGVTIYRDGSRDQQVLNKGAGLGKKEKADDQPDLEIFSAPIPRPRMLRGFTTKLNTGQGSLYITINMDENNTPVEVFANIGKSGGDTAALAEAIGRLISIALQKGVSLEELSQTLIGITGSRPVWNEGMLVKSVPDGIGKILLSEFGDANMKPGMQGKAGSATHTKTTVKSKIVGPECPECQSTMEVGDGCSVCRSCGYSHCG